MYHHNGRPVHSKPVTYDPSEDDHIRDTMVKSQSLEWILSLQLRDKFDIFDKRDKEWHIASIVYIEKIHDKEDEEELESINISITYDGWSAKWDETIIIDPEIDIPRKLQTFHSKCPYHAYLDDDALSPCKWQRRNKCITCEQCGKKCCAKCSIAEYSDCCIDCVDKKDYDGILEAISSSISDNYFMDVYIIHMITEYSMGVAVQCSNTIKKCTNDIYFKSTYRLELNFKHRRDHNVKCYQYMPTFKREGTHELYGKLRRIFCEDCTRNELVACKHCYASREAKPLNYTPSAGRHSPCSVICHNHNYVECSLCDKVYCETSRDLFKCEYCNKMHCKYCEADYNRCPERIHGEKTKDFDQIRDAVSNVLCSDYGYEFFDFDCAKIVRVIAEYSIGVAVTCSNTNIECQHEIVWNTKYEFDLNIAKCRANRCNIKMYQYSPKLVREGTHSIYGKFWRTFCEQCTANELVTCKACYIYKEAKQLNYGANASLTSAQSVKCHNHNYVECTLCKREYDEARNEISACQYCQGMHCFSCHSELKTALVPKCGHYAKKKEMDEIFGALTTVLYDDYNFGKDDEKIINILAEYSLGAVVVCSNAKKQCQNEINFDYKGEILLNLRNSIKTPNDVNIYQYIPKYPTDGTTQILGQMRRIFCEDCTKYELVDCRCCDFGKEPKPKNYDPSAPGYSIKASKCNNHKFVACSICEWEYEEDDRVKVEECAKCKLMHCDKCQKLKKCSF